ncbi:MAG: hypothetical protein ACLFR5_01035 [Halobacteriales archaeon]
MTENRYGNVYFDGVCTDTSNAAYPVDRVHAAVEPAFDPPWDEPAVHLALTLLHNGYVVRDGDGFSLSEDARELTNEELVAQVCDDVHPRVPDGDASDAAAFVSFVGDVLGALTEDV